MNIQTGPIVSGDKTKRKNGRVKWFDPSKSFGFVVVQGFSEDFLLHRSVLEGFGRSSVFADAIIEFEYERSRGGYRITKIYGIDCADRNDCATAQPVVDDFSQEFVPARVKWFDHKKGYGFAHVYGSTEDIFIGMEVLNRTWLSGVRVGEAINIRVAETNGLKSVSDIGQWA